MEIKDGAKIFIKNSKLGKFLFILRDNIPGILYPGMYGLIGGGIEDNEDPESAVRREIEEETNINILRLKKLGQGEIKHPFMENGIDKLAARTLHLFLAETDMNLENIKLKEGRKLEYFSIEEAKQLSNLIPYYKEVFKSFEKELVDF